MKVIRLPRADRPAKRNKAPDLAGSLAAQPVLNTLVVEPKPESRSRLCQYLNDWGHNTTVTVCPDEALKHVFENDVDLILYAADMPKLDGAAFCKLMRQRKNCHYSYIILLTDEKDFKLVARALDSGADDFICRSIPILELRARAAAAARLIEAQRQMIQSNLILRETLQQLNEANMAIEHDLKEARAMQKLHLQQTTQSFGSADVSLLLKPSGQVGGDMVGSFFVNEMSLGFYGLDVSGHGIASAMIVAHIAGMLSSAAPDQNIAMTRMAGNSYASNAPSIVAAQLNRLILREYLSDRYLTLCLGFFNPKTGLLRFTQAGHPHPILLRADGSVTLVGEGGMPIGLISEAEFTTTELKLSPGDRLIVYSDGLTEAENSSGEFLGEARLMEIIQERAPKRGSDFRDWVFEDIKSFARSDEFADDVSCLFLEYKSLGELSASAL